MADKVNAFYNLLNSLEGKEYIETFLYYSVALVNAKVKPAITLNLCKISSKKTFTLWDEFGKEYLKSLNLDYIELRESEKSLIVLIYNEDLLINYLNKEKNIEFLKSIGYKENSSIHNTLQTLKDRYEVYNCPHELGIFLGYPIDDVKDFMYCSKKKCLLCGYWKVYNREDEAKKIFTLYDNIKENTIDFIINYNHPKKRSLNNYKFIRLQNPA